MGQSTVGTRNATASTTRSAEGGQGSGGKFLTFYLGGEEYGLEILKVHEIIGLLPITPVPRAPVYVRGVINLRGKIIPTMDLRLRFGMAEVEKTDETCIIVVQANSVQVGIVVDRVSEVLDISAGDIQEAPTFGADVDTEYILGIGKAEGRVRLLLDIDKVLARVDMDAIRPPDSDVEEPLTV